MSAISTSRPCITYRGPIEVEGAEPGDLLVVDFLDIGVLPGNEWGFNGFFSKQNGGGFLTDYFPQAQKSIWDIKGMFTSLAPYSRRRLCRADPSRPDRLPAGPENAGGMEQPRGSTHRNQPNPRAPASPTRLSPAPPIWAA